jgi:hypothetical protein
LISRVIVNWPIRPKIPVDENPVYQALACEVVLCERHAFDILNRMRLPTSPWEKTLVIIALADLAALGGLLLAMYRVSAGKLNWGGLIPLALLIALELKTGHLVIGRSWDVTLATRDTRPRIYWTGVSIEIALFLLGLYALASGRPLLPLRN